MKSLCLILAVLCCVTLVYAAPLIRNDALTHALERGVTLAKKILNDIPGVHDACVKTADLNLDLFSASNNLEYLSTEIGIPPSPVLKSISEEFTLAVSLSHMVEGLDLHRELLEGIGDFMSSNEELNILFADVKELSAQIREMQQLTQIPVTVFQRNLEDFSSRLGSDYKVQVAAHLSLQQLRRFTQDVYRSLRHIDIST